MGQILSYVPIHREMIHYFICIELPTNDQVIYRVNDLSTKEKQPKVSKGYLIFERTPSIPITDIGCETQNEKNEIASTHEDEDDDDIDKNREEVESIEEETYEDEYPSVMKNDPSDNIIKNQDQTDQEDSNIKMTAQKNNWI